MESAAGAPAFSRPAAWQHMGPVLEIRTLGRLSLGCCDAPGTASRDLPLPATLKAQSLLAYLVLNRARPHSRDHLAEMFWGDRPDHNARRSLATALWHIRRCLPAGHFVEADVATIQFSPKCACGLDVREFERLASPACGDAAALQQACELYRGPFLDGFYDDWVLNERYRLEGLYCDCLARLMTAREACGEHEAALAVAARLLEQDPLREDAHRAAMRAYCRLGNRPAALAQFARCEQVLHKELDAPPMAETLALRKAIVAGQFARMQAPSASSPVLVAPPPRQAAQHPLDATARAPLVGRQQELQFLADAWQTALAGACGLVLVGGEAGVGKTRLVLEFADRLRWQGMQVLEGRCYEFERLLPYQPIAEALESLLRAGAAAGQGGVPDWVVAEVARLAPNLAGCSASMSPTTPARSVAGETQARLFEGVAQFLAHAARQQPLLLILEDLHWATDSTLQLLHHLARVLAGEPTLILGTFRSEAVDPAHPLSTLGRRLEREGIARRLQIERLTPAMVMSLIGRMSGAGEDAKPLADRLYEETEGNPFYLIQTLKALFEQGAIRMDEGNWHADYDALCRQRLPLPAGISETVIARVARLSEGSQDAVSVAAVAGREFDYELLKRAWGRGEEATLSALDELLRHRLIVEGSEGADYAFTHHKIQEVIYAVLPRHRRGYLHKQVGLALEYWLDETGGARPGELAHHFEQARQLDATLAGKAVQYLLQAGRQAERQSANQEAITYLQRGLEILRSLPDAPERQRRQLELQMALTVPMTVVYGYAAPETGAAYEQMGLLARSVDDRAALFTALAGLSRYHSTGGNAETAVEIGKEILALADASPEPALHLQAYREMGSRAFSRGSLKEARDLWERGANLYKADAHDDLAHRFGHDPGVIFDAYLILTLWLLGYADQAVARAEHLRTNMLSWSHPSTLAYGHAFLALGACLQGDVATTQREAAEAARLGRSYGLPSWTALAAALQAWALLQQERTARRLEQLQEGVAAWRGRGFKHLTPVLLTLQAEAHLQARCFADARAALAAAEAITAEGADLYWTAEICRLQGELSWGQGGAEAEVEAQFCRAVAVARQQRARMLELRTTISLARFWQSQGKTQAARAALSQVYDCFTEGFGTPDLREARRLLQEQASRTRDL